MERNSTLKRHDKPTRSRAALNGPPCVAVMDRTGRIYTIPWFRTTAWSGSRPTLQILIEKLAWKKRSSRPKLLSHIGLANLPAWCAGIAQRVQLWWRA
jgi:hypothetical protein